MPSKYRATPYKHISRLFNQCDGVILQSSPYVEAEAIDAWKEWYGSRPVVSIAPLSQPVGDTEKALYRKFSPGFSKVEKFLDDAVEKYGEHSIIYVNSCFLGYY